MHSAIQRLRQLAAPCAVLLVMAGCGGTADNVPRLAVSGTVTVDGLPLDQGTIEFSPLVMQATDVGGFITDGKFAIAQTDGPVEGKYKVIINSRLLTGDAAGPPKEFGKVAKADANNIPAKYNQKSELMCEVKAGDPNAFDFPLKSK